MKHFRCNWGHWTMGVDPSLATPMPYSLCSTFHAILQWHCFFRYAYPPQEQLLVPRPPCFLTHEDRVLLLIFFRRFACHSQHPQGSWHLRCLVFLWQYCAVVHWLRGLPTVSKTHQITLLSMFFELSSCARFTYTLLLVWDVARHGISTPFLKTWIFFVFRYSFCHTSYLPPFPFSATTKIILKHTRYRRSSPGGQLYFVCNDCWTYSRHVSVLSEPCWGCYIMESEGWEFWSFSLFSFFRHQSVVNHSYEKQHPKSDGTNIFCL